jgi:uroporphyrinogen-III synthase
VNAFASACLARYNSAVDPLLAGRRVLVTRRAAQAATLSTRLRALGAEVVEIPAIEIAPPDDPASLDRALSRLTDYDWLVVTSANAARAVTERLEQLGRAQELAASRPALAAVGPETARALTGRLAGRTVDLLPAAAFRAEGLLAAFAERGPLLGQHVLLPVGDRARDELAEGLRHLGAHVEVVIAYRTVAPSGLAQTIAERLDREIDLAVFASPSAIESFVAAAGQRARDLPAVVMGPVTEQVARELGLDVRGVASPSTLDGLLAAVLAALSPPGAAG